MTIHDDRVLLSKWKKHDIPALQKITGSSDERKSSWTAITSVPTGRKWSDQTHMVLQSQKPGAGYC